MGDIQQLHYLSIESARDRVAKLSFFQGSDFLIVKIDNHPPTLITVVLRSKHSQLGEDSKYRTRETKSSAITSFDGLSQNIFILLSVFKGR